jgi:hypothetical protein
MARSVGFECFKGWRPILGRLLERLEGAIAQQPIDLGGHPKPATDGHLKTGHQ